MAAPSEARFPDLDTVAGYRPTFTGRIRQGICLSDFELLIRQAGSLVSLPTATGEDPRLELIPPPEHPNSNPA